MERRNSLVKKPSVLLATALVLISTGMASAATRQHARSSTNVQDAVGPAGYAAPHEVPENGGEYGTARFHPELALAKAQKTRTREEVRFLPLLFGRGSVARLILCAGRRILHMPRYACSGSDRQKRRCPWLSWLA